MTAKAWTAYEGPGDTQGWKFWIIGAACECGWFLAKARPVMGRSGVDHVIGTCKRHGLTTTLRFDIMDAA